MVNFAVWLTIKTSKGKIAQFITTSVLFFVDIATTTSTGARTDPVLVKFSLFGVQVKMQVSVMSIIKENCTQQ